MAKAYIVEHLDTELGAWSALEYKAIAAECHAAGATFCLSSVSQELDLSSELQGAEGLKIEHRPVEDVYVNQKAKDGTKFDVFLFGGILGDDPPRDRTSELRKRGFAGRTLGPVQMTTDTAVRVTIKVVQEQVRLEDIPFVDFPELKFDEHESTEMPFRYVKNHDGTPVMPDGMIDLIKQDADKALNDLL